MDQPQPVHVGLIGYGEVGSIFAAGLKTAAGAVASAFDKKFIEPAGAAALAACKAACGGNERWQIYADRMLAAIAAQGRGADGRYPCHLPTV